MFAKRSVRGAAATASCMLVAAAPALGHNENPIRDLRQQEMPPLGVSEGFTPLLSDTGIVVLAEQIIPYCAILQDIPEVYSSYNWTSARVETGSTMRVRAVRAGEPDLVIYPESTPRGEGAYFLPATNEIVTSGLRAWSSSNDANFGPTPLIALFVPEFVGTNVPVLPGREWVSSLLAVHRQAVERCGVFGAMSAQYEFLEQIGALKSLSSRQMTEALLTKILIEHSAYDYGDALAEAFQGDIGAMRAWLPGSLELRSLCCAIKLRAEALYPPETAKELGSKLDAIAFPRMDGLTFKQADYDPETTAVDFSDLLIGYLRRRMIDVVVAAYPNSVQLQLALQSLWDSVERFDLMPPPPLPPNLKPAGLNDVFLNCVRSLRLDPIRSELEALVQGGGSVD